MRKFFSQEKLIYLIRNLSLHLRMQILRNLIRSQIFKFSILFQKLTKGLIKFFFISMISRNNEDLQNFNLNCLLNFHISPKQMRISNILYILYNHFYLLDYFTNPAFFQILGNIPLLISKWNMIKIMKSGSEMLK